MMGEIHEGNEALDPLDERLRTAQRTQVDAIEGHVRASGFSRLAEITGDGRTDRPVFFRWAPLLAGSLALFIGWILLAGQVRAWFVDDSIEKVEAVDVGPVSTPTPTPTTPSPTPTSVSSPTAPSSASSAPSPPTSAESPAASPTSTSEAAASSSAESSSAVPSSTASSPTVPASSTSTVSTEPVASGGVPIDLAVCPSGRRAPLEEATLRYVSVEQGWNRLDDLVDEQDGPYYLTDWEPGYPGTVSVEVVLAEAVEATAVRVAQNPFMEVAGTITVEVAGQVRSIALEGRGGWKEYRFIDPTTVDRFTITRNDERSNIIEVVVCVEAD